MFTKQGVYKSRGTSTQIRVVITSPVIIEPSLRIILATCVAERIARSVPNHLHTKRRVEELLDDIAGIVGDGQDIS